MNPDRQIRNIYMVNFLIFMYIIWSTLSNFSLENRADYKLYIITLLAIFVLQYLNYKNFNKIMSVSISSISALLLMYAFMRDFKYLLINIIYYLFIVFLFSKYEKNSLDYYRLKDYVKKCLITMIVIAVVLLKIDIYQKQEILKFYIIYLASAVILLRRSRAYINNLNKKVSVKNDILITGALVIFCFDFVSNQVLKLISLMLSFSGLVLSYAAIPLEYLLEKFISLIYYLLGSNLRKLLKFLGQAVYKSSVANTKSTKVNYAKGKMSPTITPTWISSILGILVIVLIIYIIYKFAQRYADNKIMKISEGVFEEREKIRKNKREKEAKRIFHFFKGGKSVNDKVIYLFAKFEYITLRKGLFKNSMTADELVETTRSYLNTDEEIKILADTYNEAKFSGRNLHENKFYSANKVYLKIRKLLKNTRDL